MILQTTAGEIDTTKVIRLYGAAIVEVDGERAEMSLEWADLNGSKVNIEGFVLVFDSTLSGAKERDKKELFFATKDELIEAINEVAQFF